MAADLCRAILLDPEARKELGRLRFVRRLLDPSSREDVCEGEVPDEPVDEMPFTLQELALFLEDRLESEDQCSLIRNYMMTHYPERLSEVEVPVGGGGMPSASDAAVVSNDLRQEHRSAEPRRTQSTRGAEFEPSATEGLETYALIVKHVADRHLQNVADIRFDSDIIRNIPDDHLRWLVRRGLLILASRGYRLPDAGLCDPDSAVRNDEESIEKCAMGHLVALLLSERRYAEVGIDAGSTTLRVLAALVYRDGLQPLFPSAVYTNSLLGLSMAACTKSNVKWCSFQGVRNPDFNAIIVKHFPRDWRPSAVVVGANALSPSGRLSTITGKCETPLKKFLIKQATNEIFFVLNPKKIGAPAAGKVLPAPVNLAGLVEDGRKKVTIVTAIPFDQGGKRTTQFIAAVENFATSCPYQPARMALYGIPFNVREMLACTRVNDIPQRVCDFNALTVRPQLTEFQESNRGNVVSVTFEY